MGTESYFMGTESYFMGTRGYQFDTLFWNNEFAQLAFSYILLLMINDSQLC